jgi:hypothetical protein
MTPDELTCHCTAFGSFQELIECSLLSGYRPSLFPHLEADLSDRAYNFRCWELCEAYDSAMAMLGFPYRAWRGSNVKDTSWAAYQAYVMQVDRK